MLARPQRGTNARLVEEVLQSNAPRALRPAEIRSTIQREKGVAIAFTSIRHALGQLESRRVAEQVADSNTWRYCGDGGGSLGEVVRRQRHLPSKAGGLAGPPGF